MKLISIKKVKAGDKVTKALLTIHLVPDWNTNRWILFLGFLLPYFKYGQYASNHFQTMTGWFCRFVCFRILLPAIERYPKGFYFGYPKLRTYWLFRPVFRQTESLCPGCNGPINKQDREGNFRVCWRCRSLVFDSLASRGHIEPDRF